MGKDTSLFASSGGFTDKENNMKANTWDHIYEALEQRKWILVKERGMQLYPNSPIARGEDGICIASDPLAREYQRIERIQKRVGLRFVFRRDKEQRG